MSVDKRDGLAEFRALMDAKLEFGERKYGPDSWGMHDMIAEAMAELVDYGNYAYLKWLQLRELQRRLDEAGVPRSLTGEDRVGVQPVAPDVHVYPVDGRPHVLVGTDCWCKPRVEQA